MFKITWASNIASALENATASLDRWTANLAQEPDEKVIKAEKALKELEARKKFNKATAKLENCKIDVKKDLEVFLKFMKEAEEVNKKLKELDNKNNS